MRRENDLGAIPERILERSRVRECACRQSPVLFGERDVEVHAHEDALVSERQVLIESFCMIRSEL